jgi:Xaa-Pro aminopeptidase
MEEVYKKRRERLVEMMPLGVAVITASEFKIRSNDTEYPYRQDSDFYYLTGFKEDGAALVLNKSAMKTEAVLFVQDKNEEMELWTGKRLGVEAAKKYFLLDDVHSIDAYEKEAEEFLKGCSTLLYEMFSEKALCSKTEAVSKKLVSNRSVKSSPRVYMDITALIRKMRLIKSPEETGLIKKALSVTKEAHHRAMRLCRPGMMEYELQAEYEYIFKKERNDCNNYNDLCCHCRCFGLGRQSIC